MKDNSKTISEKLLDFLKVGRKELPVPKKIFDIMTNNIKKIEIEEDEKNFWIDFSSGDRRTRNRFNFLKKSRNRQYSSCIAPTVNFCVLEQMRYLELSFNGVISLNESDYGLRFDVEETNSDMTIRSQTNLKKFICSGSQITKEIRNCEVDPPCYAKTNRIQCIEFNDKRKSTVTVS